MNIAAVLDNIDQGSIALPEFQRGYVWGRDQVRELVRSLYRRYPVGGLLVWETRAESTAVRGAASPNLIVKLLLDGQQRITTLYGIMRGYPPTFFQGDEKAFKDLHFHLADETFEFYGPVKMQNDPLWVDITALFKEGLKPWFPKLAELDLDNDLFSVYMERLNQLLQIRDIELHLDEITPGLSVDEVVDIFNRVNSGGTKLSKGDLALAKICAEWPDARKTMVERLDGWREHGFDFTLDWLLRVTNATLTGQALFTALKDVSPTEFRAGLDRGTDSVDHLLNLVSGRLGIDHDRVLGGRYAFPVMARYWTQVGSAGMTDADRGKLLYWYLQAALWGRHSGSTESMLNQDLAAVDRNGLDGLIETIRVWRGDLQVRPENLAGAYRGSRFYPLIYLLTRVHGARDLGTGNPLSSHLLGRLSRLELHHVFPKALLQEQGYDRSARNALANFCFLTQETNLAVGRKDPAEYLPAYESRNPGVLASQWIPSDPDLWHPDRYLDFLDARRSLLASAANDFLEGLLVGAADAPVIDPEPPEPPVIVADPEAVRLSRIAAEAVALGLAEPEVDHEVVDEATGEVQAWADLAWPDGVRTGLTEPLAFLAEPDEELERNFGELGWRFYTDEARLWRYIEEILGVDLDGDGVVGFSEADPMAPADLPNSTTVGGARPATEADLHQAMVEVYEGAKAIGYNANYFIQMVSNDGGMGAAKHLIGSASASLGFTELWERGRLDLSVEAVILQPRFQHLFSRRELRTARQRLADHGYEVPEPPAGRPPTTGRDWYVNYGHNQGRDWEDARRYGFVSAGGGQWFSGTLRRLDIGDRLFVYAPKKGYVGVAHATRQAVPFEEAVVDVGGEAVRLADLELHAPYMHVVDDPDPREWVVSVSWLATTSRESAFKHGGVPNPNTTVRLDPSKTTHRETIAAVLEHFGLHQGT